MKTFIGDCINNPFNNKEELSIVIDEAQSISKKEFLKNCGIDDSVLSFIKEYPDDFQFYKNANVYFYTHSSIEYFYE